MAKKKPITGASSFSQLNDFLNTIAPDGEIIDDNPMAKIDEWISTGSYILNAALSGSIRGGMPNRRSLGLAGEEGSGKTYVALSICRNAINNQGYQIIYLDSEGSIDKDFVARLGVDTSKVRLQAVNTIEQVNFIAAQIVDQFEKNIENGISNPKVMIVLDSLGNLSSEKEATDTREGNQKRDMTKQQEVRKLFRVNGMKFAKLGIPFIVNAHVYAKIGSYVPGNEVSGGGGLKYNVSIMFMLTKKRLEDKEAEEKNKSNNVDSVRVGVTIKVTPIKQRFAKPIFVELHIPFYKQPNPFVGLEKFVSWESCGVMRGKCLTPKEYEKLSEVDQKKCRSFLIPIKGLKDGDDGTRYAQPKETARSLVCRHIGGELPLNELFTSKVFTEEVLDELDENIIKPTFMLPSIESLEDLAEIEKELEMLTEEVDEIEKDVDEIVKLVTAERDGEDQQEED